MSMFKRECWDYGALDKAVKALERARMAAHASTVGPGGSVAFPCKESMKCVEAEVKAAEALLKGARPES